MNRISCEECILIYRIDRNFLDHLFQNDIIHYIEEESVQFITYDSLPVLEKYARMHYDLDINLEGLEVIHRLLQRIADLEGKRKDEVSIG